MEKQSIQTMLCGLRGPHKGEKVWYHEEAGHQGEKRKQRTGKHDAATLPASYHHLDGNMTRRWKYDCTAK